MVHRVVRHLAFLLATVMLAAACGSGSNGPASPAADTIPVVATTTVFADLVERIGGHRVSVHSLVPKGGEVHTFDPTPADVQAVASSALVVRNGLGLDDWLAALVEDAGTTAPVLALGEDLEGVTYLAGEGEAGEVNPHLWLDAAIVARYVDRIEESLAAVDPAGAAGYAERANAFRAELAGLDARVREQFAAIPAVRRVVVSFHDAFPYFAAAYGLTIAGTIVDAPGQDPSAGEIADLVAAVEASGASVILSEVQFSDALARTIAQETGARVVSDLYTDTLGDGPADSYLGIMTWDTARIVDAITGS
jgi:zinc/manganese transport system substrate-binding protein/manganese/iron transport system substrate-binding protein